MNSQGAGQAARVHAHLEAVLEPFGDTPVVAAMRYAVAGGKRIRARLVLEGARLHGIPETRAVWPAAAIEAMHAYSLVHDDLPCMDDDDLRRGQPTLHVKWDEATAVLAGDALQSLAFELAAHPEGAATDHARADLALSLARAAGGQGMVLGQALDIAAETASSALTLDEITRLQAGKTGALIEWAACAGPRMAEADTGPLAAYAGALGLAFQIQDDVIDVTGDADAAGKAVGKDAAAGKATFVSLLGLDAARARAHALVETACDALSPYGEDADSLRALARFVISRHS
ncbi:farnesyl diphosphate synthase [Roseovarius halotolerans]|uniref:Geranylgeranyl diphosphate synthase n=1 Tax=Roseovarius halotolerans TaxID=505353 RepID=A0A1X6YN40_9RHOB|nr:polyprenyl synthetase family protein [Roseovarius halotolerans]RKT34233.1 farnesyl diphosphate synthase [Roseovarius halotolerans]SLN25709.1 Farnesyl diphosphate synthase [Roseovarius halotolerans]